jgi:hypothetical protein
MVDLLFNLIKTLRSAFRTRADLALENLALRQQLANLRRTSGRPRLRRIDRPSGSLSLGCGRAGRMSWSSSSQTPSSAGTAL